MSDATEARTPTSGDPPPPAAPGKATSAARRGTPERILVVMPSWVGDATMATPALRALRTAYPRAHIVAEGKPHLADLVVGGGYIDDYVVGPPRGLRATWRRARELRAQRFDWAVVLGESERAAAAPFLARIRVRAGYGRGVVRRALLTDFIERPRDAGGKLLAFSMIERYLRVTRLLDVPDAGTEMHIPVYDESRAEVAARLEAEGVPAGAELVTIVAGAAFGAAKTWPPDYFARAADMLFEQRGWRTVLAPGPGEDRIGHEVAKHSKHGVTVLVEPTLHIRQLAALLERSQLALSNDTGPRSMAVALGLPVVVPIGPTEDGHTRHHLGRQRVLIEDVDCRPCRLRVCPIDHRCMTRIPPERLVAAADDLLAAVGPGVPRSAGN